jgi:hypothetical protein
MAFWIDPNNLVFLHHDDRLAFPEWIAESAERTQAWQQAVDEHNVWMAANPGKSGDQANGSAGRIFEEWINYAGAINVVVPTPPNTP